MFAPASFFIAIQKQIKILFDFNILIIINVKTVFIGIFAFTYQSENGSAAFFTGTAVVSFIGYEANP